MMQPASVAEVRRLDKEKKSSLQPTIRGVTTSIYLREEGTGVNTLWSVMSHKEEHVVHRCSAQQSQTLFSTILSVYCTTPAA
jgi:hypothetical protein